MKGALRFWYRAVALAVLGALEQVKKTEKSLFGSNSDQAKVLLHVSGQSGVAEGSRSHWRPGIGYLGYGPIRGKNVRSFIQPGGSFTLKMNVKSKVTPLESDLLEKATIALGLFGGIGARARRGFGSLTLEVLHRDGRGVWEAPRDVAGLRSSIQKLLAGLGTLPEGLPPYTAFSRQARVSIGALNDDVWILLDQVGMEMLRYRSYGSERGGKHVLPGGEEAEQIFKPDHDLVYRFLNGRSPDAPPRRAVFGLPHNYFFRSTRNKKATVNAEEHDRRASPLFVHVHAFQQRGFAALLTLLPAQFLPNDDQIVLASENIAPQSFSVEVDYQVIHDFLNRFAGRTEVWPS